MAIFSKEKRMNILIFGATGFLGRSLLPLLLGDERVESITAVTHRTALAPEVAGKKLICVSNDAFFSARATTVKADFDVVICLTGLSYSTTTNENKIKEANLDVPLRIIDFCREIGAGHVILASSINARLARTRQRGYAFYKKQVEDHLVASGLPYTLFRPSLIFGRGDEGFSRLIDHIKKHRLMPVFGDGRKLEQPIHVDEAAAFFHQAAVSRSADDILEIGGLEAMTYDAMLLRIADVLQRRIKLFHIPSAPLCMALEFLERRGIELPIHSEQIAHIDTDLDIDNTRALQRYEVKLTCFDDLLRGYIKGNF
jgi:NADH dehydrogenase